jgi:hypothetical protein
MTMSPAKTTKGALDDEIQIVAMCRALDNCRRLDIQVFRVSCYLEASIFIVNWNMDAEAKRRQEIRRNLILVNKENGK